MEQQNSDGLSSYLWNQFSLYRFFGHQPDRPAGAALGRVGTHHGDDPLFLVVVQYFGGTRSLLLIGEHPPVRPFGSGGRVDEWPVG